MSNDEQSGVDLHLKAGEEYFNALKPTSFEQK